MSAGVARGIGTITTAPEEGVNHAINILHEVDEETFSRYQGAVQAVSAVSESIELAALEKNFLRLDSVEICYRNSLALRYRSEHFDAKSALRSLSSEILNWLTAARMFLDHHLTFASSSVHAVSTVAACQH